VTQIFDCARSEGGCEPGEVIELAPTGVRVATSDGAITIKRVRNSTGQKISAAEWVAEAGIRIGDRLGR
jgi:methionyl-tRNA formyltransferase